PPLHNAVGLGEEAMTADVHAVAVVADRARKAAHLGAGFKENRFDPGVPLKLNGGGEASGARADDDGDLLRHEITREIRAAHSGPLTIAHSVSGPSACKTGPRGSQ